MTIQMVKFGILLNGRPSAKEAFLRINQIINSEGSNPQNIRLDFKGVEILTSSYADELLTGLNKSYNGINIEIVNAETPAVKETIEIVKNA